MKLRPHAGAWERVKTDSCVQARTLHVHPVLMRLAYSSNAYLNYSIEETIARIAGLGYEGLELLADVPHAWPAGLLPERKRAIRECLDNLSTVVEQSPDCSGKLSEGSERVPVCWANFQKALNACLCARTEKTRSMVQRSGTLVRSSVPLRR